MWGLCNDGNDNDDDGTTVAAAAACSESEWLSRLLRDRFLLLLFWFIGSLAGISVTRASVAVVVHVVVSNVRNYSLGWRNFWPLVWVGTVRDAFLRTVSISFENGLHTFCIQQ